MFRRDTKTGQFATQAGRYIDSKGYWCFSGGELRGVRVHRHLMEKHLGRKLKPNEHVHHRDENKLNNDDHWDGKWNLDVIDANTHNAVSAKQLWFLKTHVWPKEEHEWREYFSQHVAPPPA